MLQNRGTGFDSFVFFRIREFWAHHIYHQHGRRGREHVCIDLLLFFCFSHHDVLVSRKHDLFPFLFHRRRGLAAVAKYGPWFREAGRTERIGETIDMTHTRPGHGDGLPKHTTPQYPFSILFFFKYLSFLVRGGGGENPPLASLHVYSCFPRCSRGTGFRLFSGVSFPIGPAVLSETRAGAPPGCDGFFFFFFFLIFDVYFQHNGSRRKEIPCLDCAIAAPIVFVCQYTLNKITSLPPLRTLLWVEFRSFAHRRGRLLYLKVKHCIV